MCVFCRMLFGITIRVAEWPANFLSQIGWKKLLKRVLLAVAFLFVEDCVRQNFVEPVLRGVTASAALLGPYAVPALAVMALLVFIVAKLK